MTSSAPPSTIYCIDGQILDESQALIPVTDRGLLYGDGLFETLHAYGTTVFELTQHLQRLQRGAAQLFLNSLPAETILREWLDKTIRAAGFSESNVRLTVTRGSGPRGPSIDSNTPARTIISVTRFDRTPEAARGGVTAITASFRRQEAASTATLKTLNYIEQILARREADLAGVNEALLLNSCGLLCEGSASNLTLIRDNQLLVPDPVRSGALPGIAQLTALEAARRLKFQVIYTCLSPWDPVTSQEAFLTGSMREITPLIAIDQRAIGNGQPGPITRQIQAEFRNIVEAACQPFKFDKES